MKTHGADDYICFPKRTNRCCSTFTIKSNAVKLNAEHQHGKHDESRVVLQEAQFTQVFK